jgi:hypothetical protein
VLKRRNNNPKSEKEEGLSCKMWPSRVSLNIYPKTKDAAQEILTKIVQRKKEFLIRAGQSSRVLPHHKIVIAYKISLVAQGGGGGEIGPCKAVNSKCKSVKIILPRATFLTWHPLPLSPRIPSLYTCSFICLLQHKRNFVPHCVAKPSYF